jgi:transposase InsO family protein
MTAIIIFDRQKSTPSGSAAPASNRKSIADFTYVWTAEGWLYVSAVVDMFSRHVLRCSMSADMMAQFVTDGDFDLTGLF